MAMVIAGDRSGAGKTTVTLALLAFLAQTGERVQSFKVGPDYIDPMFHTAVTGLPCRNLDPVLTSEDYVRSCFLRHCQGKDYALVEGVMGLFDGISFAGLPDYASTAHLARVLDLPVVLVLDCASLSGSVAAIAHGYRSFDPRVKLAGVVLNRVGSLRHRQMLQEAIAPLELPVLGVLFRRDAVAIPERHLGLVPTEEMSELRSLFSQLAELARESFNWQELLPLVKVGVSPAPLDKGGVGYRNRSQRLNYELRIGVARDRAFSFYYADNLEILAALGAELVFWSPLSEALPDRLHGLYFGGGFPEMFASDLAANGKALASVRAAVAQKMPIYAECGGLMYLCEGIIDFEEKFWPLVGVLRAIATMTPRLTLGYREAVALHSTSLLKQGETVWGHEFHRSQLNACAIAPLFQSRSYRQGSAWIYEGWQSARVHASYVHLHWGGREEIPRRFLESCESFLVSKQNP